MSENKVIQFQTTARKYFEDFLGQLPSLHSLTELRSPGSDSASSHYALKQRVQDSEMSWTIHLKLLPNAQPRILRSVIYEAKSQIATQAASSYLIIVAPYLSEQAAEICKKEGVGFLDLNGNAFISFGSTYIEIAGKPNQYKETRPLKSLFSERSSRVLRVLLEGPLKAHKVQNLAASAGVSLGLVSKVRKLLIDYELARDTENGILITNPDQLLNDWLASDRFSDRTEIREYSVLESDLEYLATSIEALQQSSTKSDIAFTQWYAGYLRASSSIPPVVSLYVSDFVDEALLSMVLKARRVTSGGRLRLIRSKDHQGVTLGKQHINGHPLVSDLQILLDLQGAGLRADEQARELRACDNFNGGWNASTNSDQRN